MMLYVRWCSEWFDVVNVLMFWVVWCINVLTHHQHHTTQILNEPTASSHSEHQHTYSTHPLGTSTYPQHQRVPPAHPEHQFQRWLSSLRPRCWRGRTWSCPGSRGRPGLWSRWPRSRRGPGETRGTTWRSWLQVFLGPPRCRSTPRKGPDEGKRDGVEWNGKCVVVWTL